MRLLCAISHHGLGHLAQTAPVLESMHALRPDIEWVIWSGLHHSQLAARLHLPFAHRHAPADVGLAMLDAMRVDVAGSAQALSDFHEDWPVRVCKEAEWLVTEGIRGVVSNVAYLPLAAAQQVGLANVAFCSLNWKDICQPYLGHLPQLTASLDAMTLAYRQATLFLRLHPGLPMTWLTRAELHDPVAQLGNHRRKEVGQKLGIDPATRLVLVGFGGVAFLPPGGLPHIPGVIWLVPPSWPEVAQHSVPHVQAIDLEVMPFLDWLASSDALVTKVGYGSFVEAAGLGIPTLYLNRPDWPETPWLGDWLTKNTRARVISEKLLFSPEIETCLATLWQEAPTPPAKVSGGPALAARILELMG